MWQERNRLMFENEGVERLGAAHVLIVGCGGVGAYAAEMLARAGVGHLFLVDGDVVSETNRNRQIIALQSTQNRPKVEVLAERLRDINPQIDVVTLQEFLRDEKTDELLDNNQFDFVVDAIDTLAPKVFLIYAAYRRNIKIISSMGSGGKLDPSLIELADIEKSHHCRLAHMVRKRLHHLGVRRGVEVVYSPEIVEPSRMELVENETNKRSNVGTVSYMPAMFGCYIASYVIRQLIKKEEND